MIFKETFKEIVKINKNEFIFMKSPVYVFFLRQFSFFLTPLLLAIKLTPNQISLIGLFLGFFATGLMSIGYNNYYTIGIFIYILSLLFDFCDGNVARVTNRSTFYGRFIDGAMDIALCCALRFSLAYIALNKFQNEKLMWIGVLCMTMTPFHHLYLDRYSAFARWIKEDLNVNIKPYIRSLTLERINCILLDLQFICIIIFPFIINKNEFIYVCYLYFIINILLAIYYIGLHTIYSFLCT